MATVGAGATLHATRGIAAALHVRARSRLHAGCLLDIDGLPDPRAGAESAGRGAGTGDRAACGDCDVAITATDTGLDLAVHTGAQAEAGALADVPGAAVSSWRG